MRMVITFFIISILSGNAHGQERATSKLQEASEAASVGNHQQAIKLATESLEENDTDAVAYYLRGRSNFCEGKVLASMEDFDRYCELKPAANASLWERGIACYYAAEFQEGASQFEKYQTHLNNDVENGVWHLLCLSRAIGYEDAKKKAFKIRNDRRVPMAQIYKMFLGEMAPEEVLTVAEGYDRKLKKSSIAKKRMNAQLFYAHLYIGLFHEIKGNAALTRKHLEKAVEHRIDHYMWNVADVHLKRLKTKADDTEETK